MSDCYEVDTPSATGEIIDGEAIMLHLGSGCYFSMRGSGALIWAGVEQRVEVSAIANGLQDYFGISFEVALNAVRGLVARLVDQQLIRPCPSAGAAVVTVPAGIDTRYAQPELEIYTDMKDLLLLDPIHDVDNSGWPVPQRKAAA